MKNEEYASKEQGFLRQELQSLKNCQITFLTFSVTATAVLLGIDVEGDTSLVSVVPLSPLLILIPSWWIFTDKATSITRIVGYYRVIEGWLTRSNPVFEQIVFVGWETSLGKFRGKQGKLPSLESVEKRRRVGIVQRLKDVFGTFILITSHRYWVITYYTFLGLSALCLVQGWKGFDDILWLVAFVAVVVSAIFNLLVVFSMIHGKKSYDANEEFWKVILSEKVQETDEEIDTEAQVLDQEPGGARGKGGDETGS